MKEARMLAVGTFAIVTFSAQAQVADLVTAFDAGTRSLGIGGTEHITGADTVSSLTNPAGLGYLNKRQIGLAFRNFPESRTTVTGDLVPQGGERISSSGASGPRGFSHAGFAIPLGNEGSRGTVGIALTAGGQMRDLRVAGAGLTEGGIPASGYNQLLKNRTDFVSVGYGKASGEGGFSYGASLLYARNNTVNNRTGVPSGSTLYDEQSSGFGGVFGVMFIPKSNPNLSFGASYRNEITLNSNSGNILLYDRIPAKLALGTSLRRDGFRGGKDYLVVAAEVQHFFDGSESTFFDRDPHTVFGVGLEYSYNNSNFRIPVRLGYNFAQAGGFGYGRRNSLTYGIGVRPAGTEWGLDLSFGQPSGGGTDIALSLNFRFK